MSDSHFSMNTSRSSRTDARMNVCLSPFVYKTLRNIVTDLEKCNGTEKKTKWKERVLDVKGWPLTCYVCKQRDKVTPGLNFWTRCQGFSKSVMFNKENVNPEPSETFLFHTYFFFFNFTVGLFLQRLPEPDFFKRFTYKVLWYLFFLKTKV